MADAKSPRPMRTDSPVSLWEDVSRELWQVQLFGGSPRLMSNEELDAALKRGELQPRTLVRKNGASAWMTLREARGLEPSAIVIAAKEIAAVAAPSRKPPPLLPIKPAVAPRSDIAPLGTEELAVARPSSPLGKIVAVAAVALVGGGIFAAMSAKISGSHAKAPDPPAATAAAVAVAAATATQAIPPPPPAAASPAAPASTAAKTAMPPSATAAPSASVASAPVSTSKPTPQAAATAARALAAAGAHAPTATAATTSPATDAAAPSSPLAAAARSSIAAAAPAAPEAPATPPVATEPSSTSAAPSPPPLRTAMKKGTAPKKPSAAPSKKAKSAEPKKPLPAKKHTTTHPRHPRAAHHSPGEGHARAHAKTDPTAKTRWAQRK